MEHVVSELSDRVDDIEIDLESKIDKLSDRIDELEASLEQSDYEMDDLHSEFVIFRGKTAGEIERVKKILALATSPDPNDLEKYKTLREAFEKYEFARNLILGTNDVEEN